MSAQIGCDYSASRIYLGVQENLKVHAVASLNLPEDAAGRLDTAERLKRTLLAYHHAYKTGPYIWIEEPWVSSIKFPKSGLMMARSASFIETIALLNGFTPQYIHPSTWHSLIFDRKRPNDSKQASVNYVRDVMGYELPVMGKTGRGKKIDHNIADSICIARAGEMITPVNLL